MTIEEIRIELIEDYEILILAWLQSDSENTTLLSESLAKHATELVKSTLAPVSLDEQSEATVCDNPNCEDGIVDHCPYYKTPIHCQVCN